MNSDDPAQEDDPLDAWLLAYEESRIAGERGELEFASDDIPAPLRERFLQAVQCLRLVESMLADRSASKLGGDQGAGEHGEGVTSGPKMQSGVKPPHWYDAFPRKK